MAPKVIRRAAGPIRVRCVRGIREHRRSDPRSNPDRLLHGEWLRRENRRVDAREQLGVAYEMLSRTGVETITERARRELQVTGETIRKRPAEAGATLTAQEAQTARLAWRRAHGPRDRCSTVHRSAHRRVASAQGLRVARCRLPRTDPHHVARGPHGGHGLRLPPRHPSCPGGSRSASGGSRARMPAAASARPNRVCERQSSASPHVSGTADGPDAPPLGLRCSVTVVGRDDEGLFSPSQG